LRYPKKFSLSIIHSLQTFHLDFQKIKVAIVYVKNAWGKGIKEVFKTKFKELGGEADFFYYEGFLIFLPNYYIIIIFGVNI
jgi:ABC-type branched-subunit amino acid transport system substrate-binding protein